MFPTAQPLECCPNKVNHGSKCLAQAQRKRAKEEARRKRRCLEDAQAIVESLIEEKVDELVFIKHLHSINRDHYDDVIEERSIVDFCGYPICGNKLLNVPKQKYHIDIKNNKVYDLTERKKFCSNKCYKASEYLKQQLPTTASWLPETNVNANFQLLKNDDISEKEAIGFDVFNAQVVSDNDDAVHKDDSNSANVTRSNSELDLEFISDAISDIRISDDDTTVKNGPLSFYKKDGYVESEKFENSQSRSNNATELKNDNDSNNADTKETELKANREQSNEGAASKCAKLAEQDYKGQTGRPLSITRIEKSFKQWFTLNTLNHLLGNDVVKSRIKEKLIGQEATTFSSDPAVYERYLRLCEKMDKMDMMDKSRDAVTLDNNSHDNLEKTMTVDYEQLRRQTKQGMTRLLSYYQGKFDYRQNDDDEDDNDDDNDDDDDDDDDAGHIIPWFSHSDKFRLKLVSDKLTIALSNLTSEFGVELRDSLSEIMSLVRSFCLTAENIIFTVAEWDFVGVILLKLLSLKNVMWKERLMQESAVNRQKSLLSSYRLADSYLESLCVQLMDVDFIVQSCNE